MEFHRLVPIGSTQGTRSPDFDSRIGISDNPFIRDGNTLLITETDTPNSPSKLTPEISNLNILPNDSPDSSISDIPAAVRECEAQHRKRYNSMSFGLIKQETRGQEEARKGKQQLREAWDLEMRPMP